MTIFGFLIGLRALLWIATDRNDISSASALRYESLVHGPVAAFDYSPERYLPWVNFVGAAFLALMFLLASVMAARDSRLAGRIFLRSLPLGAFPLAYPQSATLQRHADSSGWTAPLLLSTALLLMCCFSFGWFWLRTGKLKSVSLVQTRPLSRTRRILTIAARGVGILCLGLVSTILLTGLGTSLFSGNCSGKPPFLHPQSPEHAVFTAKVIFAARSISAQVGRNRFGPEGWGSKVGDWAIGIVEEQFWGMPGWTRVVLLTNYVYWEGETYFVDGLRHDGWLTQYLPIVEGGVSCSRTKPAQNAIVDLRLLRKPPRDGKTRLLGYVRAPEPFSSVFDRPPKPTFVAGAQITVIGPTASRTAMTDSEGIYELDDLPPGEYTLQLSMPESQSENLGARDGSPARIHIGNGGVVERNFDLFWEGRMEGRLKKDAGRPPTTGSNSSTPMIARYPDTWIFSR